MSNVTGEEVFQIPIRVGAVEVRGNQRTDTRFIHDEANFSYVESFQDLVVACNQAHSDLIGLGAFDKVVIELNKGERPGEVDVDIQVVEKGAISVSGGTEVDSEDSTLKLEGCLRNVFGRCETLSMSGSHSSEHSGVYEAKLHKPRFYGTRGSMDLDVFVAEQNNERYHSHRLDSRGIALRLIDPTGSVVLGYEGCWRDVRIPVNKEPSVSITRESRSSVKSALRLTYVHDSRDIPMNAHSGAHLRFDNEFAVPFGGDVSFIKSELDAQLAIPLHKYISLGFSVKGGIMHLLNFGSKYPMASNSCISDRFMLGGPLQLRGFGPRSLGPRDGSDSLGGDMLLAARTSLNCVLPGSLLQSMGVTGHVFANCGNLVSLYDGSPLRRQCTNLITDMRASVGVGIVIPTPIGRIELNYCQPVFQDRFRSDRVANFQFGISRTFL